LPEYPSSRRDLSLVAGPGIHFGEIEKSLVKLAGPLLESLKVFDVYAGESLGDDRTAYGVRLNFRSQERTLTDADVDKVIEKIVSNLKKQLGVELRT
jgi:phenylalanyl-tRNA synthetase beta chain